MIKWQTIPIFWNRPDTEPARAYAGGTADVRHNFHPFLPGIMEPTYSEADLQALKAGNHITVFEGQEYDHYQATQFQREIERTIRKWKRRLAGAVTEADETTAKTRIARLNQKYIEFSHAAGLRMQKERANVYIPGGTK